MINRQLITVHALREIDFLSQIFVLKYSISYKINMYIFIVNKYLYLIIQIFAYISDKIFIREILYLISISMKK